VGIAANLTRHTVGELVARDGKGAPIYVVVVKASFSFAVPGRLDPLPPPPIVDLDRYAGEPAASGLLAAGDLGLPKPRVDVLLQGAMKFPAPLSEGLVSLQVGGRLEKRMRVHGDRAWVPSGGGGDPVPSRARALGELPIAWERAAGGADAVDPTLTDRRNPAGRSPGQTPQEAKGRPLPNFEDPAAGKTTWSVRGAPSGFGPIAPHWEPRASLAGTYDARWRERRAPLLPEDFKPAFLNLAPTDQQLPDYLAGEEIRLVGMTAGGRARFQLPEFSQPVTFVMKTLIEEAPTRVDTIIIEPAEERLTLVARAFCSPRPSAIAVREIFVGPLTRGRRLALELGKPFLDLRALPARRGP
jgi:hypothetical protein